MAAGPQAGQPGEQQVVQRRPCRSGSAGCCRWRRARRRPGTPSAAVTARDVGEPGRGGVAGAQPDGPLVDVDGPHVRRRGPAGQRQGDRAVAAPEVEQVAGPRPGGAGASSSRNFVPGSIPPAENTPRSVSRVEREVGQGQLHRARARRDLRRGLEVLAGGRVVHRATLPLTAMAPYTIRVFGDPVLKQRATEIDNIDGALVRLADDMLETMYDAPGLGLAAPQVGVQKRLFVYDLDDEPAGADQPGHHRVQRRVDLPRGLPVGARTCTGRSSGPRRSSSPATTSTATRSRSRPTSSRPACSSTSSTTSTACCCSSTSTTSSAGRPRRPCARWCSPRCPSPSRLPAGCSLRK